MTDEYQDIKINRYDLPHDGLQIENGYTNDLTKPRSFLILETEFPKIRMQCRRTEPGKWIVNRSDIPDAWKNDEMSEIEMMGKLLEVVFHTNNFYAATARLLSAYESDIDDE